MKSILSVGNKTVKLLSTTFGCIMYKLYTAISRCLHKDRNKRRKYLHVVFYFWLSLSPGELKIPEKKYKNILVPF